MRGLKAIYWALRGIAWLMVGVAIGSASREPPSIGCLVVSFIVIVVMYYASRVIKQSSDEIDRIKKQAAIMAGDSCS